MEGRLISRRDILGVVEIRKGWSVEDALETADGAMCAVKKKR